MKIIKHLPHAENDDVINDSSVHRAAANVIAALGVDIVPDGTTSDDYASGNWQHASQTEADGALCVVNVGRLLAQHSSWLRHLPRVTPFYAVKCNNDSLMMRILYLLGCSFDCASKGEIESVLKLGVRPEQIIYANPCKTAHHIQHAAAYGVRLMTYDNEQELYKIKKYCPNAQLLLRIAVSDPTALCPLNLKFGCDPVLEAPALLKLAMLLELSVVGISFHVGSGCRDSSAYAVAIGHGRRLHDEGRAMGHPMAMLDIGGGFPGHCDPDFASFEGIAAVVNGSLDKHFPADYGVTVIAEPGRFYAETAFSLYCTVIARTRVAASRITRNDEDRTYNGFMYYINDGVYGSFNCIMYDHQKPNGKSLTRTYDECYWSSVWGPTCDSLDLVMPCSKMPELLEGDVIVFENMGAYTLAASSEFNGFSKPRLRYFISNSDCLLLLSLMLAENDESSVAVLDSSLIQSSFMCSQC